MVDEYIMPIYRLSGSIFDTKESITDIEWTSDGKVLKEIKNYLVELF